MSKIIASPPRFQDISVLRLPAIVGISRTIDCCRDTQFLSWVAQLPHHDQTLQQSKADNRSPFSFMHDHTSFHFGCKVSKKCKKNNIIRHLSANSSKTCPMILKEKPHCPSSGQ